jgi:FHS family L-fucose permease-like MFS transporter
MSLQVFRSNCPNSKPCQRFIGAGVLHFVDDAIVLSVYSLCCAMFTLGIIYGEGHTATGLDFRYASLGWVRSSADILEVVFFFESVCWPTIYALGSEYLALQGMR